MTELNHEAPGELIIVGATGDLSRRMLLPSLYFLDVQGLLPEDMRIIGTARSDLDDAAFAAKCLEAVSARCDGGEPDEVVWGRFRQRLAYARSEIGTDDGLEALAAGLGGAPERPRVFFLSTSPSLYAAICGGLHGAGLVGDESRIVLEKPIGHDLESSIVVDDAVGAVFPEENVYRIDHYLGKETVQNLVALRFANTLLEPLWSSTSIDHVQITVAETVGVEGRWEYYDSFGALRDMLQNHMLQLLCLVAMEPPATLDPDSVRNEKVKVLRSLRPITATEVESRTVRGQYTGGVSELERVPAYLEEAGGHESDTETFVALRVDIDNWRWAGVPFYLRTGKRLAERRTEIVIEFRDVPHSIFPGITETDLMANRLVISLQPKEEISLSIMNKVPGISNDDYSLAPKALNLSLTEAFTKQRQPIAYERLLLDVIKGNTTRFVRRDEVEASWQWVDGIIEGWAARGLKTKGYAAGSWGPSAAIALAERNGHSWHE